MKIALVQNNPIFGEKDNNISNLLLMMEQNDAELYVLPEMSYTGYQAKSAEEVRALAD